MNRGIYDLIALAVIGLMLTACGPFSDLGTMGSTGDAFMRALRDGDASQSYAMLAPNLQQYYSPATWRSLAQKYQPTRWSFLTTRTINDVGMLEGTASFASGLSLSVYLELTQVNSQWKIAGIRIAGMPLLPP